MKENEDKTTRINNRLPTRFVPVGKTIKRYGNTFRCVLRPPAEMLSPQDACRGCWFCRTHRDYNLVSNCSAIQCSSFDRKDGKNVWFQLVEND